MKKMLLVIGLVVLTTLLWARGERKVWLVSQGEVHTNGWVTEALYIEDLETGTRCYGLRGVDSVSIHCVPRAK